MSKGKKLKSGIFIISFSVIVFLGIFFLFLRPTEKTTVPSLESEESLVTVDENVSEPESEVIEESAVISEPAMESVAVEQAEATEDSEVDEEGEQEAESSSSGDDKTFQERIANSFFSRIVSSVGEDSGEYDSVTEESGDSWQDVAPFTITKLDNFFGEMVKPWEPLLYTKSPASIVSKEEVDSYNYQFSSFPDSEIEEDAYFVEEPVRVTDVPDIEAFSADPVSVTVTEPDYSTESDSLFSVSESEFPIETTIVETESAEITIVETEFAETTIVETESAETAIVETESVVAIDPDYFEESTIVFSAPAPEPEPEIEEELEVLSEPEVVSEPEPPAETRVEGSDETDRVVTPRNLVYYSEFQFSGIENLKPARIPGELVNSNSPFIYLSTPLDRSYYYDDVEFQGKIGNNFSDISNADEIISFYWYLKGTEGKTPININSQGDFSFILPSAELTGTQLLVLEGVNRDNMSGELTVIMTEDPRKPFVEITSPEQGGALGDEIVVRGRVRDYQGAGGTDRIDHLIYTVPATGETGEVPIDSRGGFEFSPEISDEEIFFLSCTAYNSRSLSGDASLILYNDSDEERPFINISSPYYHDSFSSILDVDGWISKSESELTEPADYSNMTWKILGTNDGGRIEPDRRGNFKFSLSTIGMADTICLLIEADSSDSGKFATEIVLHSDQNPASIRLRSPIDNTLFGEVPLDVRGVVGNNQDELGRIDEVKSLYWRVPGLNSAKSPVFFEEDGSFFYSMELAGMSGSTILEILTETISGSFSSNIIRIYDGTKKPVILISQPAEDTEYGMGVLVSGEVVDPYTRLQNYGGIESVEWSVIPLEYQADSDTSKKGEILPDSVGLFEFEFSSIDMRGPQEITITALGKNGNRGEYSFIMNPGDSAIPSFAVKSADRSAVLNWEEVPGAISYNLYYTIDGTVPSETNGKKMGGISSPYRLRNLSQGAICSFILEAKTEESSGFSGVKKTVPLGPDGFKLSAMGDYGVVNLSWIPFEEITKYRILRSREETGEYTDISGPVNTGSYIDHDVTFGETYFYKVAPAEFPEISGNYVSAGTLSVPQNRVSEKVGIESFTPNSISVKGGYAYVAAREGGFKIIDIGDPNELSIVGELTGFQAERVWLYGDYAYVASGEGGMKIINILDAHNPILLGTRSSLDAKDVIVSGEYAYLADGDNGLKVVDVSDARNPKRIGNLNGLSAERLEYKNDFLYVSSIASGLNIVDVSHPTSPRIIGNYSSGSIVDILVSGDTAYLAISEGLIKILDISNREEPLVLSEIEISDPREMRLEGSYLFVANGIDGLEIINISNPRVPYYFDNAPGTNVTGLDTMDDMLYLADEGGLRIMQIFLQGESYKIASSEVAGRPVQIKIHLGRAFLASGKSGIQVFNISAPNDFDSSSLIGKVETEDARDFAFYKDLILLADGSGGAKIFSNEFIISDEETYTLPQLGSAETGGEADIRGIIVSGDLGFISDRNGEVLIYDLASVSDETEIILSPAGSISLTEPGVMIAEGNRLYAACRNEIVIIDISNPSLPVEAGSIPQVRAKSLAVSGTSLYVADSRGVFVFDVEDADNPELLGIRTTGFAENIMIQGNYAYLSEGYRGLYILDISHPGGLEPVSICDTVYAQAAQVKGGYAFVVDARKLNVVQIFIPEWLTR